ncbi:MAG: HlyD family efflux transporter periplasmic adaptor subunit [Chloroflexota bacterium]
MRRIFSILGILILIGVVAVFVLNTMGYISLDQVSASQPAAEEATELPQVEQPVIANNLIVVDARVVPVQRAALSMAAGGIVDGVLVQEGDVVEEGQVLIRLDSARQKVAVSRAQADVNRVQAQLDELLAGPRAEEVASAQANLEASKARLNKVLKGSEAGDVREVEAQVDSARASLAKVFEGASEEQLISARAEMANAEAALRRAQSAYNEVKWRNDIAALPQAADLEQATNNVEAARARLADLQSGATAADISSARAGVVQAEARLESYLAVLPSDIAAAEADVRNFEAQLNLLTAGAREEAIAAAEANLAVSTASLQDALVSLSETELRAPFAGTVASVDVSLGEQLAGGAGVIQLADLQNWQIETEDLTELQIVNVQPGSVARITFDALPDVEIAGTVNRIRLVGEDNRGDIVYTVIVAPDNLDDRLLWNMTAVVTFE